MGPKQTKYESIEPVHVTNDSSYAVKADYIDPYKSTWEFIVIEPNTKQDFCTSSGSFRLNDENGNRHVVPPPELGPVLVTVTGTDYDTYITLTDK